MNGRYRSRELYLLAALAMAVSCDLEEPMRATDHVSRKSRASNTNELQEISMVVIERFYERGVTLEEAEAVAESGDEEAALELLGMSAREVQRLYDRYVAALERAERGESRGGGSSGGRGGGVGGLGEGNPSQNITWLQCSGHYNACLLGALTAAGSAGSPSVGLVRLGVGSFICMCTLCEGGINAYVCLNRR